MNDDYMKELTGALKRQLFWLKHSYDNSLKIGIKEDYTIPEFDSLETLHWWWGYRWGDWQVSVQ